MANLNELRPVGNLSPFTRFCCTIGNLPTSYMVSLTYDEQLLWLCDYLKNTVIPTVNTNAEAVKELQELYIILKNYVDNYFENLDVQNEINNKLDEMTKSGVLQEIISSYLNSKAVFGFNTVNDMKKSINLINGSFAHTLGYNSINDGGKALYKIRNIINTDVIDNGLIIPLNNNLIAELIGTLTPENMNMPVDKLLNDYIDFNIDFMPNKIYEVKNPIIIRNVKFLDFHNSTIKYTGDTIINDLINFGYNFNENPINIYAGIINLKIDGNNKVNNCLHVSGGKGLIFEKLDIRRPLKFGLLCDTSVGQLWELTCNNIYSLASNSNGQAISAMKFDGGITDSFFNNLYPVNGSDCWMYSNVNSCKFSNIHGYRYPDNQTTSQIQGFNFYGNGNDFDNIIVDTADNIGITVHGNYNKFRNITLGVKTGGVGIVDSDYNNYSSLQCSHKLNCIIKKTTGGNFLQVKNLLVLADYKPDNDIIFEDNIFPYNLFYDFTGLATSTLKGKLRFLNKFVYYGSHSLDFDFAIKPTNTNYRVDVYMKSQPVPCNITNKTVDGFTVNFNPDDIPLNGSVNFDVYVTL